MQIQRGDETPDFIDHTGEIGHDVTGLTILRARGLCPLRLTRHLPNTERQGRAFQAVRGIAPGLDLL